MVTEVLSIAEVTTAFASTTEKQCVSSVGSSGQIILPAVGPYVQM